MPFSSAKQRAFLYSQHPEIAKRWRKESGPQKGLRERAPSKDSKRDQMIKRFVAKHRK